MTSLRRACQNISINCPNRAPTHVLGQLTRCQNPESATGLLAATRTGLPQAGDDELMNLVTYTSSFQFRWAHERSRLIKLSISAPRYDKYQPRDENNQSGRPLGRH